MDFKGLGLDDTVRKAAFIKSLKDSFRTVFESHERLITFLENDIDDEDERDNRTGSINNIIDPFVTFVGTTATYKFKNANGDNVEIQIDNSAVFILDSFIQLKPTTFAQPVGRLQVPNDIREVFIKGELTGLIFRLSLIQEQFRSSVYNNYVLELAAGAAPAGPAQGTPAYLRQEATRLRGEADDAQAAADAAQKEAEDAAAAVLVRSTSTTTGTASRTAREAIGARRQFEAADAAAKAAEDAADAAENNTNRFFAYFDEFPRIVQAEAYLHGKLVAEASARNILEKATLATMDPKDAAYRLYAYLAKRNERISDEDTAGGRINDRTLFDQLAKIMQDRPSDQPTTGQFDLATTLLRGGILEKSMLPAKTILRTKDEEAADAVGMPFNPDKATAEFERDLAHDIVTPEFIQMQTQKLVYGILSCMLGTRLEETDLVFQGGGEYQLEKQFFAYGCILFSGKLKGYMVSEITTASTEITKEELDMVEEIQRNGQIPLRSPVLVDEAERSLVEILPRESPILTIARIERARDIDLGYVPPVVDYGTSSTASTFGTGTNVTLLTDCAFICARILNEMKQAGRFVRSDKKSDGTDIGDPGLKRVPYVLQHTARQNLAAEDVELLSSTIYAAVAEQYVGHCSVRPGDLGRIFFATLVLNSKIEEIESLATETNPRYYSLSQQKAIVGAATRDLDNATAARADAANEDAIRAATAEIAAAKADLAQSFQEKAMPLLYHKIWSRELGSHAVAQGGAKLEESHMIIPFMVRAVSDSKRVVPTLCAVGDWIGPTEQFFRVEQTCMMEIENYSTSRPSVKYARGGQQRIINDIAAWIKGRNTPVPLTFQEIFENVDADERVIDHATTCCAMLMEAVHAHTVFTDDVRKGGLARQRASETSVRTLAERVATIKTRVV